MAKKCLWCRRENGWKFTPSCARESHSERYHLAAKPYHRSHLAAKPLKGGSWGTRWAGGAAGPHTPEGPVIEMAVRAVGAGPWRSPTFQNLQNQEAEPFSCNDSPEPSMTELNLEPTGKGGAFKGTASISETPQQKINLELRVNKQITGTEEQQNLGTHYYKLL